MIQPFAFSCAHSLHCMSSMAKKEQTDDLVVAEELDPSEW